MNTDIGSFITCTPGVVGGRPRIDGTRVTISSIAVCNQQGLMPEEIVQQYERLTIAQVYAALAYYHANREEIEADIALDNARPQLSPRIDEVLFDDDANIRLILKDQRVEVLVGKKDFFQRLNSAIKVLDAVRKRDVEVLQSMRIENALKLVNGGRIGVINSLIPSRVTVELAR